jgi:hypothetical protein
MTKVLTAEYDFDAKTLRLDEPLEGVSHHQKVTVTIDTPAPSAERPWKQSRGIWSKENGEDVARRIEEMFPPWDADE